VIQSFADAETEDIYNGLNSKRARKRLNPILGEFMLPKYRPPTHPGDFIGGISQATKNFTRAICKTS
jgi:hypothetical protein